jgi:general secretion pathway protein J
MTRARGARGFTLVEVLIALAIVGALIAVAFGGLRVAVAAWTQGEDRAEAHQHLRGVALILARALEGTYPYQGTRGTAPDPVVLFRGEEDHVEFVTDAPPVPFTVPIAFAAVIIGLEDKDAPALVVRQRPLPNHEPFTQAQVVLRDPGVTTLRFRYLSPGGSWETRWSTEGDAGMPLAIQVEVAITQGGRVATLPPLTIAVRGTP